MSVVVKESHNAWCYFFFYASLSFLNEISECSLSALEACQTKLEGFFYIYD